MSENNEGDAATLTAVSPQNITGDQLAAMLVQKESDAMQADEPVAEESQEVENPIQEEVTETPVEEEAQAEPEAAEEESEENAEEESDPVLSKDDKAIERMQKRIDKVTAEKHDLLGRLESIESQMLEKTKTTDNKGKKLIDIVSEANTYEDLIKYEKEARDAKRFALQHVGKDEIEFQGNIYSDDQIREILLNSEDVLEKIPKQKELIHQQQENEKLALDTWPDFNDPESDMRTWYDNVLADPSVSDAFKTLPNSRFVMGLIYEGQTSLAAKQQAQTKAPKKAPVAEVKKPKPVPTSVPGMNASAPPPKRKSSDSFADERQKLTSGNMTGSQLASLLDLQNK